MPPDKYWDIRTSSTRCGERDSLGRCDNHRRRSEQGYAHLNCNEENCPKAMPYNKMLEFFKDIVRTQDKKDNWLEPFIESEAETLLTQFIKKCQEGQRPWDIR